MSNKSDIQSENASSDDVLLQKKLSELEKERESHITKLFILMVEIAFIFAIPAFIVLGLGKMFGPLWWWIGFPIAVILSWTLIIYKYRKMSKQLGTLDISIKEIRKKLNIHPDTTQISKTDES